MKECQCRNSLGGDCEGILELVDCCQDGTPQGCRKDEVVEALAEHIGPAWQSTQVMQLNRPIKWRCAPPKVSETTQMKNESLGRPVGVAFGSYALMNNPAKRPSEELQVIQALATNLMAFGEIYITPEMEWDSLVLNRILAEAKDHVDESIRARLPEPEVKTEEQPAPLAEKDVLRPLVICGNSMQVHLFDPFVVGTLISESPCVPSFYYGIVKFMRKQSPYCLLTVADHYFLLWRSCGLYFVFDCYGRRRSLARDLEAGVATLLALPSLKAVNHLISNLCRLHADDVFTLRKLKMFHLHPCCVFDNELYVRQRGFEVLNEHHAVLRGHLHLGTACFKENRYKFSLAAAIAAIIYSKIDAPSTWDGYSIDKVLVMANGYYNAWTKCNHDAELLIHSIPGRIEMGLYAASISLAPIEACGTWSCVANFRRSSLTSAIKKAFRKAANLAVQVADRSYALFRRGGFYYLLDPYRHECRNVKRPARCAYLHMCSTLSMLCCVLQSQIVDLTSPSKFYVHGLKITAIRKKDKDLPSCKCLIEDSVEEVEVASLNTSLGDVKCKRTLECVAEEYGFEPDVINLDSPGVSETQIRPNYNDAKLYTQVKREKEEEEEDEEEEEENGEDEGEDEGDTSDEEENEEEDEDDEDGEDVKGKRKTRGKAVKKGEKGEKGRRDKARAKARVKVGSKGKIKADREKKEKRKKKNIKKRGKDKTSKDKSEKEEVEKERATKDKAKKDKVKKDKVKRDKSEKDLTKRDKVKKGKSEKDKVKKEKSTKDKKRKEKERKKEKKGEKKEGTKKDKKSKKDETKISGVTSSEDESKDKQRRVDKRVKVKVEEVSRSGSESPSSSIEVKPLTKFDEQELLPDCLPNTYPGYTCIAHNLAVVGSESGTYESLCNLIKTGFKCADRILIMTPWANYVAFKSSSSYFLYQGCTCNANRFRHLDLRFGTAGFLCFADLHDVILHIEEGRDNAKIKSELKCLDEVIDDIFEQYCNYLN